MKLTSADGGGRYSGLCPLGMSSSQLAIRMKKNRQTASGTTKGAVGPMASSTWSCTAPTTVSQMSCGFDGTPLVARRATSNPNARTTPAARTVVPMVSMLTDPRPGNVRRDVCPISTAAGAAAAGMALIRDGLPGPGAR